MALVYFRSSEDWTGYDIPSDLLVDATSRSNSFRGVNFGGRLEEFYSEKLDLGKSIGAIDIISPRLITAGRSANKSSLISFKHRSELCAPRPKSGDYLADWKVFRGSNDAAKLILVFFNLPIRFIHLFVLSLFSLFVYRVMVVEMKRRSMSLSATLQSGCWENRWTEFKRINFESSCFWSRKVSSWMICTFIRNEQPAGRVKRQRFIKR